MSHYDPAALTFARAAAVVGLGTALGLQASLPLWSLPAMFNVPTLSPRDRLHLWSEHFTRGAYTIVPLNGISGLALAGCAYLAKTGPSYLPATVVGRHRQAILAASAVLSLSVLGFTKLAIMPTVNKLKAIEKKIIKDPEANNGVYQTDVDIQSWAKLHLVRVAMTAAAVTLAVAELALA